MTDNKNNIDLTTLMYSIVEKNTSVMTELSKTENAVHEAIKEISDGYIAEVVYRENLEKQLDKLCKMIVTLIVISLCSFTYLLLGGQVGWFLETILKLVPSL